MASVNRVILIGNLGKDPESRYMQNGDAVCNITVATTETWKDKSTGEKKENVEWHRVVFRRKLAEIAGQYLKKGASVYIEGSIHTRKWTDKDGQDRYSTEIEANEMKMLGSKSDGASEQQRNTPTQTSDRQRNAQGAQRNGFDGMDDEEIPF